MKSTYAVISVTSQGSLLAGKIALWLAGEVQVYAREGRSLDPEAEAYAELSVLVEELFSTVDGFIFIMPASTVVRILAPLLVKSSKEPAVIVLDEKGKYVINLLGSIEETNRLATEVAEIVDGASVMSMMSDVQKVILPDMFAVALELEIENLTVAEEIAGLVAAGKKVPYFVDETLPEVDLYRQKAREMQIKLLPMDQMNLVGKYDGAVVITDHRILHTCPVLFLRPPALIAGVECRLGTTGKVILGALRDVMAMEGRSLRSLRGLASVDTKENEIGLLSVADQLELPIHFYTPEELELPIREWNLEESEFLKNQIGVGNICEASAIMASHQGELIVKKRNFDGVTIALARVRF